MSTNLQLDAKDVTLSVLPCIQIGNTLSGAATDRCIGKALSEKIYIVLFTNDKNLDLTGDIQEVRSRVQY